MRNNSEFTQKFLFKIEIYAFFGMLALYSTFSLAFLPTIINIWTNLISDKLIWIFDKEVENWKMCFLTLHKLRFWCGDNIFRVLVRQLKDEKSATTIQVTIWPCFHGTIQRSPQNHQHLKFSFRRYMLHLDVLFTSSSSHRN